MSFLERSPNKRRVVTSGHRWLENQSEYVLWSLFTGAGPPDFTEKGDKRMSRYLSPMAVADGYPSITQNVWQKFRITRTDPKWKQYTVTPRIQSLTKEEASLLIDEELLNKHNKSYPMGIMQRAAYSSDYRVTFFCPSCSQMIEMKITFPAFNKVTGKEDHEILTKSVIDRMNEQKQLKKDKM